MNCLRGWAIAPLLAMALFATGFVEEAEAKKVEARQSRANRVAPLARGTNAGAVRRGGGGGYRGNSGNALRARNMMANQNNGQAISPLSLAASSLAQAEHDYQGHRVKALHHVTAAIRHLEPPAVRRNQANSASIAKASTRTGNGAGAANNGKGKNAKNSMPQNVSDGHLRDALQTLNGVHTLISNSGTTRGRSQAMTSVQNAIQELNQALAVR